MAQNKIIFSTYCQDHLQDRFGMHKLVNSFNYFHPEYKIVTYGSQDIDNAYKKYKVTFNQSLPCIMLDIKRKYDTEYICHIDADSLVLGKLDEILKMDYDIASCLNNEDIGDKDERQNRSQELHNLPNSKYVSCGCLSTNSEKFLLEWNSVNEQITEQYGGVKAFWMCDQNWMNVLFHYGGYKNKILDPLEGNVLYGGSANFDSGNRYIAPSITREYGGNFANWSSWRDIEYKDGKFWLRGKMVKISHKSGGGKYENGQKLDWDLFHPNIIPKLQEITKCQI